MTRKLVVLCLMLILAAPGRSIAGGPDAGGGISPGPGLSGSRDQKEPAGNPEGRTD